MGNDRAKLYFKYTVLRYKAKKRVQRYFTEDDIQTLLFVKEKLRTSSSIVIDLDNTKNQIQVTNEDISFVLRGSRLVVSGHTYMDIEVGELVRREILYYANKVIEYRLHGFNKQCKTQIKNLIENF